MPKKKSPLKNNPMLRVRVGRDFMGVIDSYLDRVNTGKANKMDRSNLAREAIQDFMERNKATA
jgi:hypothetical protein